MKTRDDILRFERKKEKGRQEIISFSITANLCRILFFLSPLCLFIEEKSPFPSMFTYAVGGKENIMILFCVMLFDRKRE